MTIQNTEENVGRCICGQCSSYNDYLKNKRELLFCAAGKASCELKKSGCLCGSCPIATEYNFNGGYCCIDGAAK
ncbi:MAG: DUF2769 domain-containing protein [Candidatus Buchananbacteria bacterium]